MSGRLFPEVPAAAPAAPPQGPKRPPKRMIDAFRPAMIQDDDIAWLVRRGMSLVICCRNCPRMVEWTPADLAGRFAGKGGVKLRALHPRLSCSGPDGCGAGDVALFPWFPGQAQ